MILDSDSLRGEVNTGHKLISQKIHFIFKYLYAIIFIADFIQFIKPVKTLTQLNVVAVIGFSQNPSMPFSFTVLFSVAMYTALLQH